MEQNGNPMSSGSTEVYRVLGLPKLKVPCGGVEGGARNGCWGLYLGPCI